MPKLSPLYENRKPSNIRLASIEYAKRTDGVRAVNVAIGNVSLPMHPAMIKRMENLTKNEGPFANGVVKYSETMGTKECNQTILHILKASGIDTTGLYSQITDGGSQGMELVLAGTVTKDRPLMLLTPAYSNYVSFAGRLGNIPIISANRKLQNDGEFSLSVISEIEALIKEKQPGAMVVIPFDNPTGQLIRFSDFVKLAELCVKYDMWLISDEAYRELYYQDVEKLPSIWKLNESEVPGITGKRIGLETSSKVWNACGLRIGAIVTDNQKFHEQCVAEQTANLCANVIGQYIFGAISSESVESLQKWFKTQRDYYWGIIEILKNEFEKYLPNVIVSKPQAAIYSVVDLSPMVGNNFDTTDFVLYCAKEGKVEIDGKEMTLLVAPMNNAQLRIAYVSTPEEMRLVPRLLKELLEKYLKTISL
jgi:aspartate aminotransferase